MIKQATQEKFPLLTTIAQTIYDKKGFNILTLDVRGVSSLADFVIIAEGNIDRHLKALSTTIQKTLEEHGRKPIYVEGEQAGDWIVLDFSDTVVHLFVPEVREKYALEQLWRDAKILDIQIDTKKKIKSADEFGWEE